MSEEEIETSLTYTLEFTNFENNLRSLLRRSTTEVSIKPPRRVVARSGQTVAPRADAVAPWITRTKQFLDAVSAAEDISGFKTMFANFLESNSEVLTGPVLSDSEEKIVIPNSFFKSIYPSLDETLSGPVVFFSQDDPTGVCLPIGEIYRAAIAAYFASDESDLRQRALPILTLYDFYSILYHSLPEDSSHREAMAKNVEALCEAAEDALPGSGPGSTLPDSLGDILSSTLKTASSTLASMINGSEEERNETAKVIGNAVVDGVNKLMQNVMTSNTSGTENPLENLINSLTSGSALSPQSLAPLRGIFNSVLAPPQTKK